MTRITITDDLAKTVGRLAADHPNTAVTIAYDGDNYPEEEWLVTFDAGYGTCTYVVDDQTGEHRLAGLGDDARKEAAG